MLTPTLPYLQIVYFSSSDGVGRCQYHADHFFRHGTDARAEVGEACRNRSHGCPYSVRPIRGPVGPGCPH